MRTLRYRCARLAREGLAGRSRPYRERGSAPNHLWPTRRGEALACGGPPPRGGGRREPNPLFLAHAAGLSEIFVALETTLPEGIALARFDREAEAREEFTTWSGREKRAIAPDVFIALADFGGRELTAFVELDMGTMSHRRLKAKASGYAAYAEAEAWRGRHEYCPALLFLTTTGARARSFLAAMDKEAGPGVPFLTYASDLARRLPQVAAEERWLPDSEAEQGLDLLAALRDARRPFDEERARQVKRRREEDAERELLRTDPEALRAHLRRWGEGNWRLDVLDARTTTGLEMTIKEDGPMAAVERTALLAFSALFADPLRLEPAGRGPDARERAALADLVGHHRAGQVGRVDDLVGRLGEGPGLRKIRRRLEEGELLGVSEVSWQLDQRATEDRRSRERQERLRAGYLAWRRGEAERLSRAQGIARRLRSGPEDFIERVDRRSLRSCTACEEVAYPDPDRARYERTPSDVAPHCHFCGGRETLVEIDAEEAGR